MQSNSAHSLSSKKLLFNQHKCFQHQNLIYTDWRVWIHRMWVLRLDLLVIQFSFPWKVTGCICRHQTGVAGGNTRTLLIIPEIPSLLAGRPVFILLITRLLCVGWSPDFPFVSRRQKYTSPGCISPEKILMSGTSRVCFLPLWNCVNLPACSLPTV